MKINIKKIRSLLRGKKLRATSHAPQASLGFTLVELVVYMGIVSVFMLVLTDILVAVLDTRTASESTSQVTQDGRYIYTRLIYDINHAESVSTPLNLGDTSNSLVATINGTVYTYSLQNGNLMLSAPGSSDQLNGNDTSVSGLSFKRIGNAGGKNTFQILFTVASRIIRHGPVDREVFQTTAGLR
ncbi:MAG: PilW family protein [Candidatus Levyibacteriota bacterium]